MTGRTRDGVAFPLTVRFTDAFSTQPLDAQQLEALKYLSLTAPSSTSSENTRSQNSVDQKKETGKVTNVQGSTVNASEPCSASTADQDGVKNECVKTETVPQKPALNGECCSPGENSVPDTSTSPPTAVSNGGAFSPPVFIEGKVIVYAALSGLVSFLPDGSVHGCNHHFALMLFGYSQQELLKKVLYMYMYGLILF